MEDLLMIEDMGWHDAAGSKVDPPETGLGRATTGSRPARNRRAMNFKGWSVNKPNNRHENPRTSKLVNYG
jgi:hypothetical protein